VPTFDQAERFILNVSFVLLLLMIAAHAATKVHVITLGKCVTVKWFAGPEETQPVDLKVRPLYVDGRVKEFVLGVPHEVTDRLFVIRRAFRLNDALPEEANLKSHWRWERGGWHLVDRVSGHASLINLPEFDPYYSAASWYREYVSYCGISDEGKKMYAMVAQLGRRKPILKKALGDVSGDEVPDTACAAPAWQRQPIHMTFASGKKNVEKFTYAVRGHAADLLTGDNEEDERPRSSGSHPRRR
jgi:hypothetical protein